MCKGDLTLSNLAWQDHVVKKPRIPHCIIAGFLKIYDMNIYNEFSEAGMNMAPYYRLNQKYFSTKEITKYYKPNKREV
jgi:hypothetical protein